MPMLYAHSSPGKATVGWHGLLDHLGQVGALARGFASVWQGGEWAYVAGVWHDFGKAANDWQAFLVQAGSEAHVLGEEQPRPVTAARRRGPDHSSAGALHAHARWGSKALPLQFAIAGHHAGLADWEDLKVRIRDRVDRYERALASLDPNGLTGDLVPTYPGWIEGAVGRDDQGRRLELFTRMTFSALVDADFLDTEAYYRGPQADRARWPALIRFLPALDAALQRLEMQAPATRVNQWRRRALGWCREAASGPRGTYTLTVPTGGGKTLASLAFALRHAQHYGLRRVVVAVPFISVLDQTASTFRDLFEPDLGPDVLLEHHSAIEPVHDTAANRLAAENWDAPLIVTTQVQLFESLFSNRPSACRKLHNLANSVLVLDEVQSLPVQLLAPILDVLQDLTSNYGVTLLLTTATQPSFHSRRLGPWLFRGLDPKPVEVVPSEHTGELFDAFRRVTVRWPSSQDPVAWDVLAQRLAGFPQFLAIVHRRQDAADLWRAVREASGTDAIHLSALMCPAHRRETLADVRTRLNEGRNCQLVSTQLVEAGVDVDFPVVFRAMAGLEALAQSAGRCNREGRLASGQFEVFMPPTEPPPLLRLGRNQARLMLDTAHAHDEELDLQAPLTFRKYFDAVYALQRTDPRGIESLRAALKFESTAAAFRMIDSAGDPIFVPWRAGGQRAIDAFRHAGPSRDRFRELQPFSVNVYPRQVQGLLAAGAIETVHDSIYILRDPTLYDDRLGLRVVAETGEDWIA